jgi:hypothetical protein
MVAIPPVAWVVIVQSLNVYPVLVGGVKVLVCCDVLVVYDKSDTAPPPFSSIVIV